MSTLTTARPLAQPPRRSIGSQGIRLIAAELGVLGWLVTFIGSWIPSFWGDEAASVLSAERPLGSLWAELGRVDAVHGTYYLALHFWIDVFGASELSVRFPSAIAAGAAVAGIVILGDQLAGRRVAILAGIVAIVLPRIDYLAAEGRSYAAGTAIAVWLTVLLVTLVRRRVTRALPWIGYGVLFAASVYVFLYFVLLAVVHGIALLASKPGRSLFRRWILAVGGGTLLAAPVVVYGIAERHQIAFLAHRNYVTFESLAVIQWFGNPWFAAAAWTLIAVGILALIRQHSAAGVLLVTWLVVPTGLLLLGNAFIAPMYNIRYLSFCAPAAALLIAVGIASLPKLLVPRLWLQIAVTLVLVALALPTNVFQRSPFAKDEGSDLRQTAEVIAAHAKPGDAVVFEEGTRPSRAPRLGLRLYPQEYAGLIDPTLVTPYWQRAGLWDRVAPVSKVSGALSTTNTVWDVELVDSASPAGPADAAGLAAAAGLAGHSNLPDLEQLGFTVIRQIPVHRTIVYQLVREAS
jgi:mannosyltransferase